MKRLIGITIAAALCVTLFGGCDIIKKNSEAENPSPIESPAEEKETPQEGEKPMPAVTQASLEEGSLTIDESYFSVLGATYEELAEAYGSTIIHANQEDGVYAIFEAACIVVRFDLSMAEKYYKSFDHWLIDENEFKWGTGYDEGIYYAGDSYKPSDFVVNYVKAYSDSANIFLGSDEPVLLSTANEHFGWENVKVNFNEMYDIYVSSNQEYGEYLLSFELTPVDDDYIIDVVNICEKTYYCVEQKTTQAQPEKLGIDIFFEEAVGMWYFPETTYQDGENFYIEINDDMTFSAIHAIDMGAVEFTGIIRHVWNNQETVNDFPDMITFELDQDSADSIIGGTHLVNMALVDGAWLLRLEKVSGGRTILDAVEMGNIHTLYRKEKEKASSSGVKKDEVFAAKVWALDSSSGLLWLEHGEYNEQKNLFISDTHKATRYMLSPDPNMDEIGYEIYLGEVYIFTTVSNGLVNEVRPSRKDIADSLNEDEIFELVWDILKRNDPKFSGYLELGMKVLYTGETSVIDGKTCYDISVGTDHAEHFVREVHYSVDLNNERIYELDFVNGMWLLAK